MAAGDEITGVNGKSVKGKTKVEVAKMIQMVKVRGRRGPLELLGHSLAFCPLVKEATATCFHHSSFGFALSTGRSDDTLQQASGRPKAGQVFGYR